MRFLEPESDNNAIALPVANHSLGNSQMFDETKEVKPLQTLVNERIWVQHLRMAGVIWRHWKRALLWEL